MSTPTPSLTPTTILTPTPSPTVTNPIKWQTETVILSTSDFYIEASGEKFTTNRGHSLRVSSDPGNPTYTTLEAIWQEHNTEMRLFIYFNADQTSWWAYEIRTYNGKPITGTTWPDWVYYYPQEKLFLTPLGQVYQGNMDLSLTNPAGDRARLVLKDLRLQAFVNRQVQPTPPNLSPTFSITPTITPPLVTLTPTLSQPTVTLEFTPTPTFTTSPQPTPPTGSCGQLNFKGNQTDKHDLIIIPEDYTDLNTFLSDANLVLNSLRGTNLDNRLDKINIWTYTNISNDYSCRFGIAWCDHCIVCDESRIRVSQNQCGGDSSMVLVNSGRFGGSATGFGSGLVFVTRGALTYPYAAPHELGHSIASLNDEYVYPVEGLYPEQINCSHQGSDNSNQACPKWSTQPYATQVGCYQGCTSSRWFRSTQDSIMRGGNTSFNPPSLEGWDVALQNYR